MIATDVSITRVGGDNVGTLAIAAKAEVHLNSRLRFISESSHNPVSPRRAQIRQGVLSRFALMLWL